MSARTIRKLGWTAVAGLATACAPAPIRTQPLPLPPEAAVRLTSAVPPFRLSCERIVLLEVHKRERTLRLVCERGAERTLRVALGRSPVGPKRWAGDHRTPEGTYAIAARPQRSRRFHLFLPIDYPSPDDADRALQEGRIGEGEHARILRAHALGRMPPQDTRLGGDLGFHGEGERWAGESAELDWTYGCVALPDAEMEFIARRAEVGTPVRIRP